MDAGVREVCAAAAARHEQIASGPASQRRSRGRVGAQSAVLASDLGPRIQSIQVSPTYLSPNSNRGPLMLASWCVWRCSLQGPLEGLEAGCCLSLAEVPRSSRSLHVWSNSYRWPFALARSLRRALFSFCLLGRLNVEPPPGLLCGLLLALRPGASVPERSFMHM